MRQRCEEEVSQNCEEVKLSGDYLLAILKRHRSEEDEREEVDEAERKGREVKEREMGSKDVPHDYFLVGAVAEKKEAHGALLNGEDEVSLSGSPSQTNETWNRGAYVQERTEWRQ